MDRSFLLDTPKVTSGGGVWQRGEGWLREPQFVCGFCGPDDAPGMVRQVVPGKPPTCMVCGAKLVRGNWEWSLGMAPTSGFAKFPRPCTKAFDGKAYCAKWVARYVDSCAGGEVPDLTVSA
jgi:hypothetical protein